jgi:hypothetical protein
MPCTYTGAFLLILVVKVYEVVGDYEVESCSCIASYTLDTFSGIEHVCLLILLLPSFCVAD